jgi:predicted dehydrogenase
LPDPLAFAVVGCGRVVRDLHVPAWERLEGAEPRAVCDQDLPAAERMQRRLSAEEVYRSVETLLAEEPDLDFVVVATPGHTHVDITRQALDAGCHVLCEKPFTYERSEVEELRSLAERNGLIVCPIHNYRFKSNTHDALSRFGDGGEPVRHVDLKWRGLPLEDRHTEWIKREREYRLVLYDFAYHFLDVAQLLLGERPEVEFVDVEATQAYTESIEARLRAGDRTASIDLRLDSPTSFTAMEITGESTAASLEYYPDGFRTLPKIDTPLHRGIGDLRRVLAYGSRFAASKPGWTLPQNAVGHYRLFEQFVGAVREEGTNPVPLSSVEPLIDLLERLGAVAYEAD